MAEARLGGGAVVLSHHSGLPGSCRSGLRHTVRRRVNLGLNVGEAVEHVFDRRFEGLGERTHVGRDADGLVNQDHLHQLGLVAQGNVDLRLLEEEL